MSVLTEKERKALALAVDALETFSGFASDDYKKKMIRARDTLNALQKRDKAAAPHPNTKENT